MGMAYIEVMKDWIMKNTHEVYVQTIQMHLVSAQ